MLKKISKNKLLLSFILSIILSSIIIVPNIIVGHGVYSLSADFNLQQIPFNILVNSSIKNGGILWTWFNDLGSNFIGTFSFYNLLSPFNIIGYLFPAKIFPYLIGPIFILKYGISGICSYLFLRRYVKNNNYAVLGSLLYTFSGFQLTNMLFYHFHDVVAFFPLLLYSLDRMIYDKKKGRFALVILLCALTNWFFFIGEGIFTFIYFIIKVICKEYKINKRLLFSIIFEVIIGILMSLFILLPTMFFIIDNPRVDVSWKFMDMFIYQFSNYPELIRGMIFPPETMYSRALITNSNFLSVELFLPIVGMILVIPYMLRNMKNSFTILFIVCLLFMFTPILNSSFFLFNTAYYARWFYMPILIMSLMSIKTLEDKYSIRSGMLFTIICIGILLFFSILYSIKYSSPINNKWYLIIIIIELLFGIVGILLSNKYKKKNILILIIFIFIYVGFHGNYMVYKYRNHTFKKDKAFLEYITYNSKFNRYRNYRFNSSESCNTNIGYINRINDIRSFNSNINGSSFQFYKSIGQGRFVSTDVNTENKNLNDVLGVRYIISCEYLKDSKYEYVENIDFYKIYENKEYLEFGYSTNNYISEEKFDMLSDEAKVLSLKKKVVLSNDNIREYKKLYPNDVVYNRSEFEYTKNGFKSIIDSSGDTLAIYQIPYDEGFRAKVNDKKSNIIKVNNGFMAIKINKGINKIEVKYMPKGLKEGLIVSIIAIFVYLGYLFKIGVYKR